MTTTTTTIFFFCCRLRIGHVVLISDLTLFSFAFDSIVANRFIYAKSTPVTHVHIIESLDDEPILQVISPPQAIETVASVLNWKNQHEEHITEFEDNPSQLPKPLPQFYNISIFTQAYPNQYCPWLFFK